MNTNHTESGALSQDRIPTLTKALEGATPAQADGLMRDALLTLVVDQQAALAAGAPLFEAAGLAPALALFPEWCVRREFGISWTEAEQTTWQRICGLLVTAACAQTVGDDLVLLLRDPAFDWDEPQEIDWAVRWWELARRAGLPVDADFGECWRAYEWQGLLHDLVAMGTACRAHHEGAQPLAAADLQRRLAHASRVALRYGPLKPLLRLLEPLSGARVQAGFTF